MPNLELTVPERVALRELELTVPVPNALRAVMRRFEYNTQDASYNIAIKTTQVGQLRAYLRDNRNGDARLAIVHAKLECLFERCNTNV